MSAVSVRTLALVHFTLDYFSDSNTPFTVMKENCATRLMVLLVRVGDIRDFEPHLPKCLSHPFLRVGDMAVSGPQWRPSLMDRFDSKGS